MPVPVTAEYLHHCLKRLSNILTNSNFLNGTCAQVEQYLSDQIRSIPCSDILNSDRTDENLIYCELAKEIVSSAFGDFHLMVSANANDSLNTKTSFFDDFQSKCEAWRFSFYVCCIFLDSDLSIS